MPLSLLDEEEPKRTRKKAPPQQDPGPKRETTTVTRMFIIWSIFGLVERIMKKTTSLGSESIPNVKNKNFALESFFLMISCKILKRLKNLDLV